MRKEVAAYDYTDEDGQLLYQCVRYDPKDFRQRHKNGDGWEWNLDGCRRVLYHLPEIVAARLMEERVFFVEGEKDVETLRSWGLVATSIQGGVNGKWEASFGESLADCALILLPDNDDAGKAFMDKVGQYLLPYAKEVWILHLDWCCPMGDKEDISDLVSRGLTLEIFEDTLKYAQKVEAQPVSPPVSPQKVVRETAETAETGKLEGEGPPLTFDSSWDLIPAEDVEPKESEAIAEEFVFKANITIVAGLPGCAKTTLGMSLTWAYTQGEEFMGKPLPSTGRVLWLDFDQAKNKLAEKFHKFYGYSPKGMFYQRHPNPLNSFSLPYYRQYIRDHKIDLVIVDTFADWIALPDMESAGPARQAMQYMRLLCDETEVAILGIGHPAKGRDLETVYAVGDSRMFSAKPDVVAMLKGEPKSEQVILHVQKNRPGEREWQMTLEKKNGRFVPVTEDTRGIPFKEEVYHYIARHSSGVRRQEILMAFPDKTYHVVDKTLERLLRGIRIQKEHLERKNEVVYLAVGLSQEAVSFPVSAVSAVSIPPSDAETPAETPLGPSVSAVSAVSPADSEREEEKCLLCSRPVLRDGFCQRHYELSQEED